MPALHSKQNNKTPPPSSASPKSGKIEQVHRARVRSPKPRSEPALTRGCSAPGRVWTKPDRVAPVQQPRSSRDAQALQWPRRGQQVPHTAPGSEQSQENPRPCRRLLRPSTVGLHYPFLAPHLPPENETWCRQRRQRGGSFLLCKEKRQKRLPTAKRCGDPARSPQRPAQARPLGARDHNSRRPPRPRGRARPLSPNTER